MSTETPTLNKPVVMPAPKKAERQAIRLDLLELLINNWRRDADMFEELNAPMSAREILDRLQSIINHWRSA